MVYNPFSLKGKTVLVTGASSGIGKGTAIECSKLGAKVVITGRNLHTLEETFNSLNKDNGVEHEMIIADLHKEEDIDRLIEQCPQLNGLVLNAGIVKTVTVRHISRRDIDDVFGVNTFAPITILQKLLKKKKLPKGSSVVFTSSIDGNVIGTLANGVYASSKAAINGFIKVAAKELAPKQIRLNSVMPGFTKTNLLSKGVISEEQLNAHLKEYPIGRYAEPEDIAYGIIYLLSDAASWVTGTALLIDGGYTL